MRENKEGNIQMSISNRQRRELQRLSEAVFFSFAQGNDAQGNAHVLELLKRLEQPGVVEVLNDAQGNEHLRELLGAMQARDYVRLADVLQYRLLPLLKSK
ncbi:MAG: hypothetical protein QMC95_01855 [Desulfitobacteriaceae bacterium]|nr:hypothetical protein [Desulfitobacteriaceae bacterium]MDI6879459.1 hypothetical protein [Desulfitobacteriaceae bacterium]MDI6912948.1 hypothetical protein [Desulfitobacteriaceae bacterium]